MLAVEKVERKACVLSTSPTPADTCCLFPAPCWLLGARADQTWLPGSGAEKALEGERRAVADSSWHTRDPQRSFRKRT